MQNLFYFNSLIVNVLQKARKIKCSRLNTIFYFAVKYK